MRLSVNKSEIIYFLEVIKPKLPDYPIQMFIDVINNGVAIQNKIYFNYKIPLGHTSARISIRPDVGALAINLESVNIDGFGLFGLVHKKATEIMVKDLNSFPRIFNARKVNGEVLLQVNGVYFQEASCSNGNINLEAIIHK